MKANQTIQRNGLRMIKWITPPMYGFLLMMLYAGFMGKEGLKEYPIGNPLLLWEEYLIIVGIVYIITILRSIYHATSDKSTQE
jgi:hypothetical protein